MGSHFNIREFALNGNQILRPCWQLMPITSPNDTKQQGINFTPRIIYYTIAIGVKKDTIQVSRVQPKENFSAIPNHEFHQVLLQSP